jgi:hypothetical protein
MPDGRCHKPPVLQDAYETTSQRATSPASDRWAVQPRSGTVSSAALEIPASSETKVAAAPALGMLVMVRTAHPARRLASRRESTSLRACMAPRMTRTCSTARPDVPQVSQRRDLLLVDVDVLDHTRVRPYHRRDVLGVEGSVEDHPRNQPDGASLVVDLRLTAAQPRR